ncbi:hypothetical protein C7271_11075 [filamentous cyanobacterium CCP5]|nr:hypothetical protein C7271_11075 [filamentous cyanobacterium CCP5]
MDRRNPTFRVMLSKSLLGLLGLALVWLMLYGQRQRWRQIDFARQEAKAFRERTAVKSILDILDYEEFRLFYVVHPATGETIRFEATDPRLQRALRSHDQMSKVRTGLNEIQRLAHKDSIRPETLAIFERYEQEEFFIELTLRDWFDSFLGGLEYFDMLIESGLISARDIRPFIIYWIQLIGDRRFRRKGGSGFYDQLSHYIYWAGYSGVQRLFERYGFKVLPPPYTGQDFTKIGVKEPDDTARALSLAKAAHLVYEDREYVNDIVDLWLSGRQENQWMRLSPREYVVDVIKQWQQEGQIHTANPYSQDFKYLDMLTTDTQAFFFRRGDDIILVFRGSQQLKDWKTNFKIRLREFTTLADQTAVLPKGYVHRGFLEAWHSVEKMVVHYLRKWWSPDTRLWITGHSLGGALANMAALSLDCQGFTVSGLYTFGQPRIADWQLVRAANKRLGDRMFRYANNNDVVPLIPPQLLLGFPPRVYGHMGRFRYFSWNGELRRNSFVSKYWIDRLIGFVLALRQSGLDAIDDHKMEFYVANLQTALAKEQEMAKIRQEQERLKGDYRGED